MLMPKRVKHRKVQRGRMKGKATRGNVVTYGEYGMQAAEPSWITSNQIEAARIAMTRYTKRGGKVWIKIFPDKPVTSKPAETRMGSGKGSPDYWVAVVKPGRVLFEISGVPEDAAREAIRLAGHKLPCKVKFVKRGEAGLQAQSDTPDDDAQSDDVQSDDVQSNDVQSDMPDENGDNKSDALGETRASITGGE